jgi:2-keto-3-deoxy-L-arabinonate dehydratase
MATGEAGSKTGFFGIYPMLYALFDRADRLDPKALARQVDGCLKAGAHGLAILGIASEMNKLSTAERSAFLEIVAEANRGRAPLAVTVAEASVPAQVAFAKEAEAAGASWLILQPPPVKGVAEIELVRFFGRVADACSAPVAIQNNPVNMDVWLSNDGLRSLVRQHGNVRLLKGEGPLLAVRRMIEALDGTVDTFGGLAGKEAPGLYKAGCVGLIPAPDVVDIHVRIFDAVIHDDEEEADRLYREVLPLITFVNASVGQYLCYGKRLVAGRMGLGEVIDRAPAVAPDPFGESMVAGYAGSLPALDA